MKDNCFKLIMFFFDFCNNRNVRIIFDFIMCFFFFIVVVRGRGGLFRGGRGGNVF